LFEGEGEMIEDSTLSEVNGVRQIFGQLRKSYPALSTDSRTIDKSDIFLALKGEKFNGEKFVQSCLDKGVRCHVLSHSQENIELAKELTNKEKDLAIILVDDTLAYLQTIATRHGEKWKSGDKIIIGLTGSNGKTTSKEILFYILNKLEPGKIHGTSGNYNNHIGVPLTMLGLKSQHNIAVVEMGTNNFGEIKDLCAIARPDYGYITNIGDAHLEAFKNREGVFSEKRQLFDYILKSNRIKKGFVIFDDDFFLKQLPKKEFTISFGKDSRDYSYCYKGSSVTLEKGKEKYILKNSNLIGEHNFINVCISFLLSKMLFKSRDDEIINAIKEFKPKLNRSEKKNIDGIEFFTDAYNANPSSMVSSLVGYLEYCEKMSIPLDQVVFILGDMNELGDLTRDKHLEIGRFLKNSKAINPVFVGRFTQYYAEGFENPCQKFSSVEKLLDHREDLLKRKTNVFLKASRSVSLEKFLP
jgi:UDP-N-acetylmuramoyl-tripeptide--D-alanyl-D-alanine ligase